MNTQSTLEALREENEELRERVRYLENELRGAGYDVPREWNLTPSEEVLVRVLLSREGVVSRESLLTALYALRPIDNEPDINVVGVFIHKVRKKLSNFDIQIECVRGRGYCLPDDVRAKYGPKKRETAA